MNVDDDYDSDNSNDEERLSKAKFQVEFYFGQSNYHTDENLRNLEGPDRWIPLEFINDFKKMKKFKLSDK